MPRFPALLLVSVALSLSLSARGQVSLEDKLRIALKLSELTPLVEAKGPSIIGRRQAAAVVGEDPKLMVGGEYYRSSIPHPARPEELVALTIVILPSGFDKKLRVVVCCDYVGIIVSAAIIDEKNDPVEEWSELCSLLVTCRLTDVAAAGPRSRLEERRLRAARRATEDDRLTDALFRQQRMMTKHWRSSVIMRDRAWRGEKFDYKVIDELLESFEPLPGLGVDLKPLLGEATKKYVDAANQSLGALKVAQSAAHRNEIDALERAMSDVGATCDRCHYLRSKDEGPDLLDLAKAARRERGIGRGYFLMGHDLQLLEGDEDLQERAQPVADALRRAVLLLSKTRLIH